ncbi:ROK family transcriptional regulator [Alkaliphilus peptidifermentans]|uniref:Sugar kinase of the NBD/HSP70 family, may contain an N-terminal HTH domain n=1 Tax=Alkaliphilus peptidifermentans DSM 18978 TaxID=1120976 RepID=A0A1G5ISB7_9FIRM|nr:ROK family protein [Alkaliphilus peptidifermentans]SCY78857.1 Sugar kinase of the NBD/HSP70 family, may contain an N-terminal HTH domain [Alkaliphilus peptidifermentans DSM 18978]
MKKLPNNMMDIKIDNINTVFDLIRSYDEIARVKLAELTGLTRMSVTRIVGLLMEHNLVYEKGEILSGRGRPAKKLYVNAEAIYSLTAYLDVDDMRIAVVNLKNQFVFKTTVEAKSFTAMEDYVDAVYREVSKLPYALIQKINTIAFVCPGIINPNNGEVVVSSQLKWRHAKLGEYAHFKFGKKTIVRNDVKSALIGEIAEIRDKESLNLAYMDIGFGVGVGVISDGKLLMGANNNAGEIGHITIDYHGRKCECGRIGCLNTVLNIQSILDSAFHRDQTIASIGDIVNQYRNQTPWALELIGDVCTYLSIALNNIIYAYDPCKIVLGGKFFDQFEDLLDIMLASEHFKMHNHYWSNVEIERSKKGDDSYLIGGAIDSQKWIFNQMFTS